MLLVWISSREGFSSSDGFTRVGFLCTLTTLFAMSRGTHEGTRKKEPNSFIYIIQGVSEE
jgi:hypothetical protein